MRGSGTRSVEQEAAPHPDPLPIRMGRGSPQTGARVTFNSVGIIGGGAWGTALAQTARLAGREVLLWALEADVVAEINARHANTPFLPGVPLDPGLRATGTLADVARCDVVLMVAPAQHVRTIAGQLAPDLPHGKPVVMCAKGLEQSTGKLMGEVMAESPARRDAGGAVGSELRR